MKKSQQRKTLSIDAHNLTSDDIKFLYNELRKSSIIWSGRKEVLRLARRRVFVRTAKNGNPVYKLQWQCSICRQWFLKETDMEVDHIQEIGGYTEFTGDWNETFKRIFPRPVEEHLQCICIVCHQKKTGAYNSARSKFKRKIKDL